MSIKDISGGVLDFSNTRFVPEAEHVEMSKRCRPERGDVLFCRIGTLGRSVVVDTDREFSLFVSVGLIKMSGHIDSAYFNNALNSPCAYEQYHEIKAGGSHTNKLNLGPMRSVLVPVPPLAEQRRIVAKVDELMALCDDLGGRLERARGTRASFASSAVASFA